MPVEIFTYADLGIAAPLPVVADSNVYIGADAAGDDTLNLWLNINGHPVTPFNNAAHIGYGSNVHEAGLYWTNHENRTVTGDFLYEVALGEGGTVLDSLTITWSGGGVPADSAPNAAPPPVLTATSIDVGVQLDWTASVSADSHFTTIRYDLFKSTSGGAFVQILPGGDYIYDTLGYLDTDVIVGHTYTYQVQGLEPIIGQGDLSNIVTITWTAPSPPPTPRASWGVLAS